MLSTILGSALVGMDSHTVQVEVDITKGFGAFEIVGLPDAGVKESRKVEWSGPPCSAAYQAASATMNAGKMPALLLSYAGATCLSCLLCYNIPCTA